MFRWYIQVPFAVRGVGRGLAAGRTEWCFPFLRLAFRVSVRRFPLLDIEYLCRRRYTVYNKNKPTATVTPRKDYIMDSRNDIIKRINYTINIYAADDQTLRELERVVTGWLAMKRKIKSRNNNNKEVK